MSLRSLALSGVFAVSLTFNSAWAYLDPGTGTFIVQGLIAALAAGIGAITIGWQRLRSFVNGLWRTARNLAQFSNGRKP